MANRALAGLPQGWCVWPTPDGWAVGQINEDVECGGYSVSQLAEAPTYQQAIVLGKRQVARDERARAARAADYERRKSAGQLTPWEVVSAYLPTVWSSEVAQAGGDSWRGSSIARTRTTSLQPTQPSLSTRTS